MTLGRQASMRRAKDVPFANANGPAGLSAGQVVAEYVRLRGTTDARSRAILGKYAKQLILGGRWHDEDLLAAVRAFAKTKRHPRFFEEWVREVVATSEVETYERQKQEEALPRGGDLRGLDVAAFMAGLRGAA